MMAESPYSPFTQNWIRIINKEHGWSAAFPSQPLKINLDLPFQNIPPTSQLYIYSAPTQREVFVLSTFHSPSINANSSQEKPLYDFFKTILTPYLFFNSSTFYNQQKVHFQKIELNKKTGTAFQFSFEDQGIVKKLEGIAFVKDQTLYVFFYLTSEKHFERKMLNYFLNSIQFSNNFNAD